MHGRSVVMLLMQLYKLQCAAGLCPHLLNLAHEVSNSLTGRVNHKFGASNVIISHAGAATHVRVDAALPSWKTPPHQLHPDALHSLQ